jgi:hypothetical protein
MINSPVKKIFITQVFGVNPAMYAKFGLKGHNGIDYRAFLPNGNRAYSGGVSEVFAPHSGKIIENRLDSNGYGWYIKIENEKYGSVLGHFSQQSPLGVGSSVKIGQFVGFQGTTGNSTGIHLHWGFYKHPRNRANGYGGFINQQGLYQEYGSNQEGGNMSEYEEAIRKAVAYDEVCKVLEQTTTTSAEATVTTLSKIISDKERYLKERNEARSERDNYAEEIKGLNNQISLLKKDNKATNDALDDFKTALEYCEAKIPAEEDLEKDYEATGRKIIKVIGDTTIETSYKRK